MDNFASDVGQAVVAALMAECQQCVIKPQRVQNCRLKIVNMDWRFDRSITQIVGAADDLPTFKEHADRLYWWSSHAMLDMRGSASKTEIVYRSMFIAKGLEPPPLWRPGVSADIEALMREHPGLG